jgi:hypothetical protein
MIARMLQRKAVQISKTEHRIAERLATIKAFSSIMTSTLRGLAATSWG